LQTTALSEQTFGKPPLITGLNTELERSPPSTANPVEAHMTAKKTEPKAVTADGILTALEQGAKSMTAVAKALGYKSGSSGVLKKLVSMVPDLEDRLAINAPASGKDAPKDIASGAKPTVAKVGKKTTKPATEKPPVEKKTAGKGDYPMPECVPFRPTSGYAMVWAILHSHKEKGISKPDLIAKYRAWSGKPQKNAEFDAHVVVSPKEDGSCHRSAAKAAQSYWVQRENDFLRLHLIGEGKK
jgi:hypothetical protein